MLICNSQSYKVGCKHKKRIEYSWAVPICADEQLTVDLSCAGTSTPNCADEHLTVDLSCAGTSTPNCVGGQLTVDLSCAGTSTPNCVGGQLTSHLCRTRTSTPNLREHSVVESGRQEIIGCENYAINNLSWNFTEG